MNEPKNKINELHGTAQFSLFVSSYLPLFILLIVRQVSMNVEYLNWGGFNLEAIIIFFSKFLLSSTLIVISIIGYFGYRKTLGNIEEVAENNGFPVKVIDVKNKNSESIGYIATYIIPFLFQSFDSFYECASVLFLLIIIYRIYINSSLLLINPLLSFSYGIYEVEYTQNSKNKNGLIISKNKWIQDEEKMKFYEIGHKLFFATNYKFKINDIK
ncbi:hypothetical protein [Empedobacter falsenii]|uniref:Uncharacterized protein n=2 Tax=Weeksellaceae TaxID=2762318 RepID=A0A376GLA1_9FLAO|nr:hypothetical protein [Empedobacter falsenii]STD59306.1 Uncharacterised protein [Empedobacter falsenii]